MRDVFYREWSGGGMMGFDRGFGGEALGFGVHPGYFFAGMALLMLWSLIWKGLALYKAARRGEHWWFMALLVVNTAGILEILYLYVFTKGGPDLAHGGAHKDGGHADHKA